LSYDLLRLSPSFGDLYDLCKYKSTCSPKKSNVPIHRRTETRLGTGFNLQELFSHEDWWKHWSNG